MNRQALIVALAVPLLAAAGAIATFQDGYSLKAQDLNTNFQHIHSTMVGGHGARLVNSDVSANAGISHSKLATPQLVPKAWAESGVPCTASTDGGYVTCDLSSGYGVTSILQSTAGHYIVNWSTPRPNDPMAVLVTPIASGLIGCPVLGITTAQAIINCFNLAGTPTSVFGFSILMLDNDN
jgi:hypothetical protein